MKKIQSIARVFIAFVLCLNTAPIYAQQSNLNLTPSPIANPEFTAGKVDGKITGTFYTMDGTGFEMTGVAFDGVMRKAMNDKFALSGQFGLGLGSGDITLFSTTVNQFLFTLNFGGNAEFQLVKNEKFSLIGYGGMLLPISILSFDKSFSVTVAGRKSSLTPQSITTVMFAIPIGLQAGIRLGENWKLVPHFGLTMFTGGTANSSYLAVGPLTPAASQTIEGYTQTSFGADLMYLPKNISFGTLLQNAASSGSGNDSVSTTQVQFTWRFGKKSRARRQRQQQPAQQRYQRYQQQQRYQPPKRTTPRPQPKPAPEADEDEELEKILGE